MKLFLLSVSLFAAACASRGTEPALPPGAYAQWDLSKAWSRQTSAREEICINGLWQFRTDSRPTRLEHSEVLFDATVGKTSGQIWKIGKLPAGNTLNIALDPRCKRSAQASYRFDLAIEPNTNFYQLSLMIPDLPTERNVTFQMDILQKLESGSLYLEVQDAQNMNNYNMRLPAFPAGNGWQTVKCNLRLPGNVKTLKVLALRNGGSETGIKGSVWLDNIQVVKTTVKPALGVAPPVEKNWGYIKVPGSWFDKNYWANEPQGPSGNPPAPPSRTIDFSHDTVYWAKDDPGINNLGEIRFGWFKREIRIPRDWDGKNIYLAFKRISTHARVYCDGREVGTLGFQGGEIDITDHVKPDRNVELAVLVEAMKPWEVLPHLLQEQDGWSAQLMNSAGISGDVFLGARPRNIQFGKPVIRTETPGCNVNISIPLNKAPKKDMTWHCAIRPAKTGSPDRKSYDFTGTLPAGASELKIAADCPDAELWDIWRPSLYEMTLKLEEEGTVVDEIYPETFGFRQFEIRGRDFYLNGIKLHLTPCAYAAYNNRDTEAAVRHWMKQVRAAGYNFVYIDESSELPGNFPISFAKVCDEMGMLAALSTINTRNAVAESAFKNHPIEAPECWNEWTKITENTVMNNINHPSIVMWRMNMNMNIYNQDQNPLFLDGVKDFEPGSGFIKKANAMKKTNDFVRSLDPTRPVYNHACGKTGDVYTLNNYLGWPEIQDLREWLKYWAASKESKPLFMVEQATPYPGDFQMRDPKNWFRNEPLVSEYGAIILGEKSFLMEENDYVDYLELAWNNRRRANSMNRGVGFKWHASPGYICYHIPPIVDKCITMYYESLLPAWRTWGLSGGMNAWENSWRSVKKRAPSSPFCVIPPSVALPTDWNNLQRPGRSADTWNYSSCAGGELSTLFDLGRPEEKEYFEPTLRAEAFPRLLAPRYAYIGGPAATWYTQDHAFYSGEQLTKSVIIINDSRKTETFKINWRVMMGTVSVASGESVCKISPAENAKQEFTFTVPQVTGKTAARIEADVRGEFGALKVAPFELQFWPQKNERQRLENWALFDPEGTTAAAFARAEIRPGLGMLRPEDSLPKSLRVLVIGSLALKKHSGAKLFADLSDRIADGLQVLVMPQDEETLKRVFGMRAFTPGSRQVWIRDRFNPVFAGLEDSDFADWRGATSLGPLAEQARTLVENQRYKLVWRCSREGVVASTLAEKPHSTAFRPLIDVGFDLRYTALWEAREGRGRMIFCQLDLDDRLGKDPAVDLLMRNLVKSLSTPPAESMVRQQPKELFSTEKAVIASMAGKVLILRRGSAQWLAAGGAEIVSDHLKEGGVVTAFGLNMDDGEALAAAAGDTFGVDRVTLWKNPLDPRRMPEAFAGLSSADTSWRKRLEVVRVYAVLPGSWRSETGALAVAKSSTGQVVWVAATADDFDTEQRPDLIFTKVKTARLEKIILANLGVDTASMPLWSSCLGPAGKPLPEFPLYMDKRQPRDDPYAYMRW